MNIGSHNFDVYHCSWDFPFAYWPFPKRDYCDHRRLYVWLWSTFWPKFYTNRHQTSSDACLCQELKTSNFWISRLKVKCKKGQSMKIRIIVLDPSYFDAVQYIPCSALSWASLDFVLLFMLSISLSMTFKKIFHKVSNFYFAITSVVFRNTPSRGTNWIYPSNRQ